MSELNTTSINDLPTDPAGGGSIGGSSGSSISKNTTATSSNESFWINTYDLRTSNLSQGFDYSLMNRERILISIENENHYVGVISTTVDSAFINIMNTSANLIFKVGDEKKFDLNSDNLYDLWVKLNSIVDGKANISVKYLIMPADKIIVNDTVAKPQEKPIVTNFPEKVLGLFPKVAYFFSIILVFIFIMLIIITLLKSINKKFIV
jgi:hypothetical protein